jgi:uncharacterized phage protein gp47/JayE
MAFEPDIPTIGTLVQRAVADVDAELGAEQALLEGSDEHVQAAVSAGLAHGCYGTLRNVAKNIVPSADNDETALAEHARFWLGNDDGRRDAAPATLPIVDDGDSVADTEIPAGTRWRASDGALYETIEDLIFGTDAITVQSIAAEGETGYGASGNRVPGSTLTLVTEIIGGGLSSTWTVDGDPADGPIGGGADQEAHEELYDRVEFTAQNPPSGGTSADYVRWAREVTGVGKAWAYPRLRGPGTVDVFFTRATGSPIPDAPLVANVQAHLDEKIPITVGVAFATAPIAAPTAITIAIKPNNATTRAAVTTALEGAFKANAQPGNGTVYFDRSWLTEAASAAVGELGHTLTVPSADFTPALGHYPTLGAITFGTKA